MRRRRSNRSYRQPTRPPADNASTVAENHKTATIATTHDTDATTAATSVPFPPRPPRRVQTLTGEAPSPFSADALSHSKASPSAGCAAPTSKTDGLGPKRASGKGRNPSRAKKRWDSRGGTRNPPRPQATNANYLVRFASIPVEVFLQLLVFTLRPALSLCPLPTFPCSNKPM